MIITRVVNNNVVCVLNERQQERILLGSGIGFQKKKGQEVDKEKIEKEFYLKSKNIAGKLYSILTQIPMEHIKVTETIIEYAKDILNSELNENLYLTLTDHINFAITRCEQGLVFSNALLWEVKRFYPEEFKIGLKALEILDEEFHISLPEDEAASIAMHIVNAEMNSAIKYTIKVTEFIQNVLNLIRYEYKINLDEDSINYNRFIIHLKFFAYRIINNTCTEIEEKGDKDFLDVLMMRYPKEYECSLKIAQLVKNNYNKDLSSDELIYLIAHIKRITMD